MSDTKKNDNGIIPFDDYSPGETIDVPLTGTSRKGTPYRVIHKLKIPDNSQLRRYNNMIAHIEQPVRGRRQKKKSTVKFKTDTSGASAWLWERIVVEVQGYPGGKESVPLDHKERAVEEILPDLGVMDQADEDDDQE